MTEDSDWRLQGQEGYLLGVTLYRRSYSRPRQDWDHDHCEFCFGKITVANLPDTFQSGYCTEDEYRWVCETCFRDFRERFRWER